MPLPSVVGCNSWLRGACRFAVSVLISLGLMAYGAPNVVFIVADDLGLGDLGCYGQSKIRTPRLDRLAAEGMRLTTHYSGHNVCAPSRCVLMTGRHPGHAYIRDNRGGLNGTEGQEPVPPDTLKVPRLFQRLGYATGAFGKWGLGPVGSTGDPLRQGFDRFFGFNCQSVAHNYYPTHLWDNDRHLELGNPKFSAHQRMPAGADPLAEASYAAFRGSVYAPDRIGEEARRFVREHRERPFFLFYPTTVPHLALQVPEDSLAEYAGKFPEEPYLGERSYLPHRMPRAAYAAMVTRMDREVGRLLDLLEELGLSANTLVVFTSDNGPLYDRIGGTDTEFFNSAAGLRGRKGSYYEGGIRVPCLVRWPGRIAAGTVNDRVTGFEDWLPTLAELLGESRGPECRGEVRLDGISFAPTLLGKSQRPRPFLYREAPGYGGQQCVRVGNFKGIRTGLNPPASKPATPTVSPALELYDLARDPAETTNLAGRPESRAMLRRMERILAREHAPAALWPIRALDGPDAKAP